MIRESVDRLDELISVLQLHRNVLKSRIVELDTPSPSLDDGISPILAADTEACAARMSIAVAASEIKALMAGPEDILKTPNHNHSISLYVINHFGLAKAINPESNEGKTFEELAALASPPLDPDIVKRVIRHATLLHIFKESPVGVVRHNAASRYLAQSPQMQAFIGMTMDELVPCSVKVPYALERWPGTHHANQCAYQIAHQTDQLFYQHMGNSPRRSRQFGDAMSFVGSFPGMEISHLVDAYPWNEIGDGKVVDVGGSHGTAGIAVTEKFPSIQFIVQDLPNVVDEGSKNLSARVPNISFMAHNFFDEQPVKGADVYFLRMICHNWSDERASVILRQLAQAMEKHSRIVIMEHIIPEPGAGFPGEELMMRSHDLIMLQLQNGRARGLQDFEKLCNLADSGLRVTRTFNPQRSSMGLIEIRLDTHPVD